MRYAEAVQALYGLRKRGIRLSLERIEAACAARGHPERGLPVVHIAGTNGKGSTSAAVAAIGKAAGLRTGLFTSPHLHRFVERVRTDGRPLAEADLARRVRELFRFAESHRSFPELSFYETATLLAFEVFRDKACELVVLEVGLGGRLDATNVVPAPLVTVITRVAMDHARILGSTLGRIAREKAGILKPGRPLISSVRDPSALRAIRRRALELDVPCRFLGRDFAFEAHPPRRPGGPPSFTVDLGGRKLDRLRPGLSGDHQLENLTTAVAVADELRSQGWGLDEGAIRRGIARVRWPGRLERVAGRPPVFLDAAHNPDGCRALTAFLKGRPEGPRILVFGAMKDKDVEAMLGALAPAFDHVVFVEVPMERAAAPPELTTRSREAQLAASSEARSVKQALRSARRLAGREGLVVVAGSLFLLAEARAELLGCRTEPPIRM